MARRNDRAARVRQRSLGRCAARSATVILRRLPRTPGIRRAQASARVDRPRAHRRRHRLPRVRNIRTFFDGALDPGLRDEPREPSRLGRGRDDVRAAADHESGDTDFGQPRGEIDTEQRPRRFTAGIGRALEHHPANELDVAGFRIATEAHTGEKEPDVRRRPQSGRFGRELTETIRLLRAQMR